MPGAKWIAFSVNSIMSARRTIIVITALLACLLAGCRGVKYTSNRVLGIYPSVYVELKRQLRTDRVEMNLDIRKAERKTRVTSRDDPADSVKKMDRRERLIAKIRSKYALLEMKRTGKSVAVARAELESLKGDPVAYAFEYSDPRFDVVGVEIAGGDPEKGTIEFSVRVAALRDLEAGGGAELHYVVLDGNGPGWLAKGTLDPFAGRRTGMVAAGEPCSPDGSSLTLDCLARDFRRLGRVVFTDRHTYESLRK